MKIKIKKIKTNPIIIIFLIFITIQMLAVIVLNHKRGVSTNGVLNISITYIIAPFIIALITIRLYENFKDDFIELNVLDKTLIVNKKSKKQTFNILKIESIILNKPHNDNFIPTFKNQDLLKIFDLIKDAQKTTIGIKRGISLKIIYEEEKTCIVDIDPKDYHYLSNFCRKLLDINPNIILKNG